MAKGVFKKANVFCTGFEWRNLIGVGEDCDKHVLVTCKGVVKRYNVVERRQVRNWITKSWLPFTSPAIYHPRTQNITAVINNTNIIQWTHESDDIDLNKKIGFEIGIHQLLVKDKTVFVLFTNGHIENLVSAIQTCREPKPGFLKAGESIRYASSIPDSRQFFIIVERTNNEYALCRVHFANEATTVSQHPLLGCADLTGVCVLSTAKLITLWSTGDIYTFDLGNDHPDHLPGERHEVENQVDVTRNTKILELSPWHIVIIGLDKQDGNGLMVVRDIKFGMTTCVRKLKMYIDPPLAWVTVHGVVVGEGSSLSIVPYSAHQPDLASVFGSRISDTVGAGGEVCHGWLTESEHVPEAALKTVYWNLSDELCAVIQHINRGAISESLLAREVITYLVEKRNILLIDETMEKFHDLPESCLIDGLNFYLQCGDEEFDGFSAPDLTMKVHPLNKHKASCPFIKERAYFISRILRKSFTIDQLILVLHRVSFSDALRLISYLHFLIASGLCDWTFTAKKHRSPNEMSILDNLPSLCQVGDWLGLILDVNYHQMIMSSEISVHQLLLSCFDYTTQVREFLLQMEEVKPLVKRVMKAKPLRHNKSIPSLPYSLERLVVT